MTTIQMHGGSDDLVEYSIDGQSEEFQAYGGWAGRVVNSDGGGLRVAFEYGLVTDAWEVRVTQLSEDLPIPADWTITIGPAVGCSYSPAITITTPEPVELRSITP
jgi:hypothetical protein